MNILLELSKRHNDWLRMATKICRSEEAAKDLVQDMYLKIGSSDFSLKKEYANLIYTIMDNIHNDQLRKQNYQQNKEWVHVKLVSLPNNI